MTWAQIIDGRVANPVTVDPADCYAAEWLAEQPPFVEVPAGTLHGAIDNGDGTFSNPSSALVPSDTLGRDITWDEFLDVGMATDATKTNAILLNMPVVAEFGRKYLETPGIQFADATNPAARLARLMAAAKAANLIDDAFLATFMQTWVALFPLMVPENE